MSEKAKSADWSPLFRVACSLIDQANADHPVIDNWSLGGGTALMLQIDHRQSDDVDIFLQDHHPQPATLLPRIYVPVKRRATLEPDNVAALAQSILAEGVH